MKNSEHFADISQQHNITDNFLVSFDVESLFTNVPVDEALKVIMQLAPTEL